MPGRWWWRGESGLERNPRVPSAFANAIARTVLYGPSWFDRSPDPININRKNRLKGVSDPPGLPRVRHLFQALEKGFRRRFHTLTPHIRSFSLLFYPFYPDFAIVLPRAQPRLTARDRRDTLAAETE